MKQQDLQPRTPVSRSGRDGSSAAAKRDSAAVRAARDKVQAVPRDAGRRTRRPGRPSVAAPYREFVAAQLDARPSAPTTELLDLARKQGYVGGKSAFYAMVARLRPHVRSDRDGRPRPTTRA
jgi:hypothetical protein